VVCAEYVYGWCIFYREVPLVRNDLFVTVLWMLFIKKTGRAVVIVNRKK